jgi:hypothetical protein
MGTRLHQPFPDCAATGATGAVPHAPESESMVASNDAQLPPQYRST